MRNPQSLLRFDRALQWLSLDVFHHQIVRANVVQGADVRMIERRNGARLALEPFTVRRTEDLDRDGSVQTRVSGFPDFSHPARADGGKDLIGTKLVADRERHTRAQSSLADGFLAWITISAGRICVSGLGEP